MLNIKLDADLSPQKEESIQPSVYDTIIIGAGPAGLSAAIYTGRGMLNTLLIEKMGSGGQAALTDEIDNYPGFPNGINGFDLSQKMEEQVKRFGVHYEYATVESIKKTDSNIFEVKTDSTIFHAKTVLIASGTSPKRLNIENEPKFIGRGISFCATCDAAFYKDKEVAVIGGGDSAVQEAIYLTKFASKVYIIHRRDKLRAAKMIQEQAFNNDKIEILWDTVVNSYIGQEMLEGVVLKNVKTGETKELKVPGVFLFVGLFPNTEFLSKDIKDLNGFVITDEEMRTNISGLFSAGDCRVKSFRQVVTAVGDGAVAANSIEHYLENR